MHKFLTVEVHFLKYGLDNFYENCPQFGKDIIKNHGVVFYRNALYKNGAELSPNVAIR